MNNQIKAVVFDYGNVVARFDVGAFIKAIIPITSLSIDNLKAALKRSSEIFSDYETGLLTSEQFFERLSVALSLRATRDEFINAYVNIFVPIPTTAELIHQLKGYYRLGLLSNTSDWHFRYQIQKNPVFPLFDAVTLSFRVKARKPDELIYRDILRQLNVDAHNCVYIDDIKEYADAANAIGMLGIHYTTHEELMRMLRGVGVTVVKV
jgi:putative hydrolase of the HAD superfamily